MTDQKQPVIIYGAEWCPPCHITKEYLTKLGVKYEYRDVDSSRDWLKECVEKSGQNSIPVLDFNGTIIVGFDRPKIDAVLTAA